MPGKFLVVPLAADLVLPAVVSREPEQHVHPGYYPDRAPAPSLATFAIIQIKIGSTIRLIQPFR